MSGFDVMSWTEGYKELNIYETSPIFPRDGIWCKDCGLSCLHQLVGGTWGLFVQGELEVDQESIDNSEETSLRSSKRVNVIWAVLMVVIKQHINVIVQARISLRVYGFPL